ncbi:MAG: hypothetical protein ACFB0G_10580 [Leptolyngbyaceae cyanobacterium]
MAIASSPDIPPTAAELPQHLAARMNIASDFRVRGITYWQKLVREGVPKDEARKIASAIAKFELFDKPPSPDQKQLISRFSAFICRAQLWRSDLLI